MNLHLTSKILNYSKAHPEFTVDDIINKFDPYTANHSRGVYRKTCNLLVKTGRLRFKTKGTGGSAAKSAIYATA